LTLTIIITPAAELDIADAIDWYDAISPELTISFMFELTATLGTISEQPEADSPVLRVLHRTPLRRFPYSVFYRQVPNAIQVIAVFSASGDPRCWLAILR
jgi:toxin ParE1/3/4